ncbi:hypothetical protein pb186bvf_011886 [Paramecium bursaria]
MEFLNDIQSSEINQILMNQKESSKWKEFLQIFRHVDILASPYEFNVLESQKSLTAVGGMISTAILVLMILYSINIFDKNYNTNVIYAGTETQSDALFSLNQNNSVFALQFQTQEGEVLSFSDVQGYLLLNVSLVQGARIPGVSGLNLTFKQFEAQNCSQQVIDRLNFQPQAFNKMQFDQLICYDGDYDIFGQNLDQQQSISK